MDLGVYAPAGYATDPEYGQKLIRIMQRFG